MPLGNVVRKVFEVDGSWTCPAGVKQVRVYARAALYPAQVTGFGGSVIASDFNGNYAFVVGNNANQEFGNNATAGTASTVQASLAPGPFLMVGPASCLHIDGTYYTWSSQANGEGGVGSVSTQSQPNPVVGGYKWKQITGALGIRGGLLASGAAYMFGRNVKGQLGDGTVVAKSSPVAVTGGFTWKTLALCNDAGPSSTEDAHMLGITTAGVLYAWGNNANGQLGVGNVVARSSPVAVTGVSGIVFKACSVSADHSLAIASDGTLYAWGANTHGQLGVGDQVPRSSPIAVLGSTKFVACAAGAAISIAISTTGAAYCFGRGINGAIGDGTALSKSSPTAVTGGFKFVSVGCGGGIGGVSNCYGITVDGVLKAWGDNSFGQLGDGTTVKKSSPVSITGSYTFRTIREAVITSRVVDVEPGTTYAITLFAAVAKFGDTPIFGDEAVGALPIQFVLEY